MHNTDGVQCDDCEVGFNNLPWREGNETDANVCESKFVYLQRYDWNNDLLPQQ